jgi:MerR family transcriptional regulator, light-induced transcriptional regulator
MPNEQIRLGSSDDERYLSALLAGNRREASLLIHGLADGGRPLIEIYQDVMLPALYQVGTLWETNRISVAAEHLCSAVTEGIMNELYPLVSSTQRTGLSIIVGSVENELHQIGAKMVCDVFEMNGWETRHLGADRPLSELLRQVETHSPNAVGLSLSVYFHLGSLEKMIYGFRASWPALPIIIGGQGLRQVGVAVAAAHPGVMYFPNLYSLDQYLKASHPKVS